MNCTIKRFVIAMACAVLAVAVLAPAGAQVEARGPAAPAYCSDGSRTFWFIHASDTHIGTSGSTDNGNLSWLVTTARATIGPLFIVVTGDLTDSTNGNIFGYPNGPYQAEWDQYKNVLAAAGISRNSDLYYDIPGNHDAYNDASFSYFKNNAIQGATYSATGQVAWTKTLPFGTYHFVAVNTADNTGAGFSILPPYGDHAGLDEGELAALANDLGPSAASASLTFVFGHHPVTSTGQSSDTYLYYGASQFVSTLSANGVTGYNYGHVHDNVETIFTGNSYTGFISPGIRYSRVASVGKDSPNTYSVISVDCNGVNSVTQPIGTWPLVLITAPVNRYVGGAVNPFAYDVTAGTSSPIRALVFDAGTVGSVQFRLDGGTTWYPMARVGDTPTWAGAWDSSAAAPGEHTIEVRAAGTTTRTYSVRVRLVGASVNHPPVAVDDAHSATQGSTLTVAAPGVLSNDSDPDGNSLAAELVTQAGNGSVSLSANGGFTYTPVAGFAGVDTFTYQARDSGGAMSNAAVVTITVAARPTTDTVAISSATYTRRTRTLAVKATSSAAPSATLRITSPFDLPMQYNAKPKVYVYQGVVPSQPSSVTVASSAGGTATKTVTIK